MDQHLYVITADGADLAKIGVAASPQSRLRQLQCGSPTQLTLIHASPPMPSLKAYAVERAAHRLLSQQRRGGEWFAIGPDEAVGAVAQACASVDSQAKPAGHDMDRLEFTTAIVRLGLDAYSAGVLLQASERQVQRWLAGDCPIPPLVAKVIRLLARGRLRLGDLA